MRTLSATTLTWALLLSLVPGGGPPDLQHDYFTEQFDAGDNDLCYLTLTLIPDGSDDFYALYVDGAEEFPVDPSGGHVLDLGDDIYSQVRLADGTQVYLYGQGYDSFYVGSNGYITFDEGDTTNTESLENHFTLPRISGLFNTLGPVEEGLISWKQLGDRAVVSYENVPEYGLDNWNSFQVEMFFDGTIRLTYLEMGAYYGLVGLSAGGGVPEDFVVSDLTAYPYGVPDADGDGLPDFWEYLHGLDPDDPTGENGPDGDPEGDGLTNIQEYVGEGPGSSAGLVDGADSRAGGEPDNPPDVPAAEAGATGSGAASGELVWVSLDKDAGLLDVKAAIEARGGEILTLAPEGRLLVRYPADAVASPRAVRGVAEVDVFVPPPATAAPMDQPRGLGERPPTPEEQEYIDQAYTRVTSIAPNELSAQRALLDGPAKDGLPSAVDNSLSQYFPPIDSQGAQPSCTFWATCYYYNTFTQAADEGLDVSGGNTDHICSPAFLYPLENNGLWSGGVTAYVLARLNELGCCSLTLMPYDESDYTTWPSEAAWFEALNRRTLSSYVIGDWWEGCTDEDVEAIKQHLSNGHVAVTTIQMHNNVYNYHGGDGDGYNNDVLFADSGVLVAGHAITIVGYDDDKSYFDGETTGYGAFLIANSWGPGWGTCNTGGMSTGYIWIAYEYFKEGCREAKYNSDRESYRPQLYAVAGLDHSSRGFVSYRGGIGPSDAPDWTSHFAIDGDGGFAHGIDDSKRVVVDLTDAIPSIGDYNGLRAFVEMTVAGTATASGSITNADLFHDFDDDGIYGQLTSGDPVVTVSPGTCGYATFQFALDDLLVSPSGTYFSGGPEGGPFAPASRTYVLSNTGTTSLNWAAAESVDWLDLSATSGTLGVGGSDTVDVTLTSVADTLSSGAYSASVTFTNSGTGGGVSRGVSLDVRSLAGFSFDPIPSPQAVGVPIDVTIAAVDSRGDTVTAFTDGVDLTGMIGVGDITVGDGTSTGSSPLYAYSHDARTQVIYLASEIGSAGTIMALSLDVATVPGQPLENWTIRMKHTTLSQYFLPCEWGDNTGWTTVYQNDETISSTGWVTFEFSVPFHYNGADNLMVDFSFNNASGSTQGYARHTQTETFRIACFHSDSHHGDPLCWSDNNGFPNAPYYLRGAPNIRLLDPEGLSITPTSTGNFVDGVWSGQVTVVSGSSTVWLQADDGNGHQGASNQFDFPELDADGDGIYDSMERDGDADGDTIPNYLDTDADGDGIPDSVEGDGDADGDGRPDYLDTDADGDGLLDSVEGTGDTDGDGTPDYLDTDADGDRYPDDFEAVAGTDPLDPMSHPSVLPPYTDLAAGEEDALIYGASQDDMMTGGIYLNQTPGTAVGDLDSDGVDDLIVTSSSADGPGESRASCGEAYVFFGGASFTGVWDTAGTVGAEPDVAIYGADIGDCLGSAVATGDLNGDGVDDLILGAKGAKGPDEARNSCGEAYVIYGSISLPSTIDIAADEQDVTVYGASAYDSLATDIGTPIQLGDMDGDGVLDLVLVAGPADGPGDTRNYCGEAYVIYGSATLPATIDLAGGEQDVTVYGASTSDQLGAHGMRFGDVNGDDVADLVLGVAYGAGPGDARNFCGEAYVIYGSDSLPATVDLGADEYDVVVYGAGAGDYLGDGGSFVVGDVNNDGFDDIVIGSNEADGPGETRDRCGEAYVVHGAAGLSGVVDLANGDEDIRICGAVERDSLTDSGAIALGDVNGDGVDDLLLGAPYADAWSTYEDIDGQAGEAYVIYGGSGLPESVDLLNDEQDVIIYGITAFSYLTSSALAAGDLNADGIDDIILASNRGRGPQFDRTSAGEAYVIHGAATLPAVIDLGFGGADAIIYGATQEDWLVSPDQSLVFGDLNGDGADDLVLSSFMADGPDETREDAGEAYVIFGVLADTDGDGIPDYQEIAWGLDPNDPDTDDDGLSDGFEVGYDGNADDYNPYDPVTNPTGTDLDANDNDTDGDGSTDGDEVNAGTDPLDPAEYPVRYVDIDATGANDGTCWSDAFTSIQDAIDAAVGGGLIWVAEGTYVESITLGDGSVLYGGFDGTETILSQRNIEDNPTTIDADGAPYAVRIVSVAGVRIDGFVITGGDSMNERGGGIRCGGASPIIANCTIMENAAEYGGGVYCTGSGTPTITNCTITNNSALEAGGGILCYSGADATILQCMIVSNSAEYGGGVQCESAAPVIEECTVVDNSADAGGGIFCYDGAAPIIRRCIIAGNSSDYGGGMACVTVSSPTVVNCAISGNSADLAGAGVFCADNSSPAITNCTLSSNAAPGTGGLVCGSSVYGGSCDPAVTNTLFQNNESYAVSEGTTDSDPVVTNCLFYGNSGGDWRDEAASVLTGAAAINALAEATSCVDGNPTFQMDGGHAISGTWTSAPSYSATTDRTTLTDATASLVPGALVGRLVNCDTGQRMQALITANTATTVEVVGDVTGYAASDDAYVMVDYHLMSGSGAKDEGTATGAPATDFESDARPIDSFFDIGFDEFLDTDGDTLSDWFEMGYDGDPTTYNPYDPTTNPTGTDLDYNDADTDNNGYGDGAEVAAGADPLNPDSYPVIHVDIDATGANNGSSWADAFTRIEDAMGAAGPGDVIWVAEGTYLESLTMKSGVEVYGGFAGSGDTRDVSIYSTNIDATSPMVRTPEVTGGLVGWSHPICTHRAEARTQVIYLSEEIGEAGPISELHLNVYMQPSMNLQNWRIRMKHTSLSAFGSADFENSGWTEVNYSNLNHAGLPPGWATFTLSAPFDYNGTDNLMVDFSYDNGINDWDTNGQVYYSEPGGNRSVAASTPHGEEWNDPRNWGGATGPARSLSTRVPDVRFKFTFDPNHVVVMDTITAARLDGFTITGGAADGAYPDNCGGGIYCHAVDAATVITNCTVTGNSAEAGGGIYVDESGLTVSDCTVDTNTASGTGGGMYITMIDSAPVVADCLVTGNSATGGAGARVYKDGDVATVGAAFTNCTFESNICTDGGYASVYIGTPITGWSSIPDTFTDCTFANNTGGGALVFMSTVNFTDCRFLYNSKTPAGGLEDSYGGGGLGLRNAGGSITHCVFQGNTVTSGSGGGLGIEIDPPVGDPVSVTDSVFLRNTVTDLGSQGGGVYTIMASPTIERCYIASNAAVMMAAGAGMAFELDCSASVENCVIATNYGSGAGVRLHNFESTTSFRLANCTLLSNWNWGIYCNNFDPGASIVISNTIIADTFEYSAGIGYGVFESFADDDPTLINCLFFDNDVGDYKDHDTATTYTGAASIDANVPETTGSVDGDPLLGMDGLWDISGALTEDSTYDPATLQTTLTDAAASFTPGILVGRDVYGHYIVANTETTITTLGDMTAFMESGDNYAVLDYHLSLASPAIDAGTTTNTPAGDADLETRPFDVPSHGAEGTGTEYDIGADEYVDTDGDNLPDQYEWSYDGDTSSYDPYDPVTNPTGGDLDYNQTDTDGDGYDDGQEVAGGSDPTDSGSFPLLSQVYVDLSVVASGSGASWSEAKKTITEGLAVAAEGAEVWVAEGTYAEAIEMTSGVSLYGGFDGTETLLSQRDWEANVTTIDARTADAGGPADHVVIMDTITDAGLDGFTVTGGDADGSYPDCHGGGIYCNQVDATNTIANCTVSRNAADSAGGLYCSSSSPTLTNCTVSANAAAYYGGGLYCSSSSPTLTNCTVSGNSAPAYYGGGLYCCASSSPTLTNCTVSGNAADRGGGLYCSSSSPTLTNCTVSGNAAAYYGGGLYCSSSSPTLTNCTVSGNSAPAYNLGGGLLCYQSSPSLTNTIFEDNAAFAVYEADASSNPVTANCLFHGNPHGDYYDNGTGALIGAAAINALSEAHDCVDGDPLFQMDSGQAIGGTWTAAATYDPNTNRTMLTDTAAALVPGALVGRLANCDMGQYLQALITANTAHVD